jgi:hypothetical protein
MLCDLGYALVEEELPEGRFRAFALDPIRYCAATRGNHALALREVAERNEFFPLNL